MLQDLKDIAHDAELTADVCIVGAGAAGITLARSLLATNLQVCLLECGGFDHEADIADLGAGENLGQDYHDLVDSRLRFFGGTTNIWGGRCVPLDPEDFQKKSWVPHSGWPIELEDLQQGYQLAHQHLEIGPALNPDEAWQRLGKSAPDFLGDEFTTGLWYFDEQTERFSANRCGDLLSAENLTIITHATVTRIQANPTATGVQTIEFGGLDGKRAQLNARAYVLAAGGIENARLLLMNRDVETQGIGNRFDQVGRYFMEHPHGRLGEVVSANTYDIWSTFEKRFPRNSVPIAPVLRPSLELQSRAGILNTALTFKLQSDPTAGLSTNRRAYMSLKHQLSPNRRNRQLWHLYNRGRRLFQRHREPLVKLASRTRKRGVYAMIRGEQAPNPDSRVLLSADTDGLGLPRADLHWQRNAQDKHTLRVLADALDTQLQAKGMGTFSAEPWIQEQDHAWPIDPTVGNHPIAGYHHMGTTRMAEHPQNGVTDRNCQVFGYPNLYIAGSSLFPTSGWANPTLTILALCHRLSSHLQTELAGSLTRPSET